MAEKHSFQAEVQQVLNIVINSLYTDKEIFVRELVSNASDALEKLRQTQLTEKDVLDPNLGLEISVTSDENGGVLTIQDFGIGMTREELVENLGTIAHSGSKAFLEAVKASGGANDNLIGQFGVGFYSVFMASENVEVFTRSWRPGSKGYRWESDGSGTYSIEEADGLRRGTKIVIRLKSDCKEFAQKWRVQSILEKYSSYIEFPIALNGDRVNTQEAIWLKQADGVSDDEYKAFYKFHAKGVDDPLDWMHFSADAPIEINALVYIPGMNMELPGMPRLEPAVALHCRKVLIDPEPKGFLPEWLRFLNGVVDSADLPLNISRESMQDSALVRKLGQVIVKRFCKHLERMEKSDEAKFSKFYKSFSLFLKEGAATDFQYREQLVSLLRFESSYTRSGELTSLQGYVDRMLDGQKEIFFLAGPNRAAIESGPYFEAFKARGLEVLFCYEAIDDFVMSNVGSFKEKRFVSGENDDIDLPDCDAKPEGEPLADDETRSLCEWLKETLGEGRVSAVAIGKRLVDSPVVALSTDKMMSASMRRLMRAMGKDEADKPEVVKLEINPSHPLIKSLSSRRKDNPEVAVLVAEQLLDNALIAAGLLDDPRSMVNRLNTLLARV